MDIEENLQFHDDIEMSRANFMYRGLSMCLLTGGRMHTFGILLTIWVVQLVTSSF